MFSGYLLVIARNWGGTLGERSVVGHSYITNNEDVGCCESTLGSWIGMSNWVAVTPGFAGLRRLRVSGGRGRAWYASSGFGWAGRWLFHEARLELRKAVGEPRDVAEVMAFHTTEINTGLMDTFTCPHYPS